MLKLNNLRYVLGSMCGLYNNRAATLYATKHNLKNGTLLVIHSKDLVCLETIIIIISMEGRTEELKYRTTKQKKKKT